MPVTAQDFVVLYVNGEEGKIHDNGEPIKDDFWHALPWGGVFRISERPLRRPQYALADCSIEVVIEVGRSQNDDHRVVKVIDFAKYHGIVIAPQSSELSRETLQSFGCFDDNSNLLVVECSS